MAIIYSYPKKQNPTADDLLLISDKDDRNITKTVSLSSIQGLTSGVFGTGTVGKLAQWTSPNMIGNYTGNTLAPMLTFSEDINNLTYTMLANVNGSNSPTRYGSVIKMTIVGTALNTVVSSSFDIMVNHSQDIHVKSLSGDYTEITLRITSNNNEDYSIEAKTNSTTSTTNVSVSIFPLSNEVVTQTLINPGYTGQVYEHTATEGWRYGGTDGGTESSNVLFDGNVGIGSSSPGAKLRVRDTSGNTQAIIGHATQNLYVGVDGTNVDLKSSGNDVGTFSFTTGNSERMRITSSGNVGIGITNPASVLEIKGGADAAFITQTNTANTQKLQIGNAFSLYAGASGGHSAIASDTILAFATASTESMRIDQFGDIGIGTAIPDSRLTVKADTANVGLPVIKPSVDGFANGYTLIGDNYTAGESQLNLGISYSGSNGVLSRGVKVSSTDNNVFLSSTDNYSLYSQAFVLQSDGSFRFLNTATSANTPVDTAVSLSERMRITRDGKVGIGTTAPTSRLHIQDTSGSTSQIRMSAASANSNFAFLEMEDNTVNTAKLTLGTTYGYNVPKPALSIFNSYTTLLGDATNPNNLLDGTLRFNCSANSHYVEIEGPDHSGASSYSLKLPNVLPSVSNQILESNASGALSWIPTPAGSGGITFSGTTLNGLVSRGSATQANVSSFLVEITRGLEFGTTHSIETSSNGLELRIGSNSTTQNQEKIGFFINGVEEGVINEDGDLTIGSGTNNPQLRDNGQIRGTYYSADNTAGVTGTLTFPDNNSVTRTLVFKNGICTSAS